MTVKSKDKTIIGRAERVVFPTCGRGFLHARIDTGAKTSSIWATDIQETDNGLIVRLTDPEYDIYQHIQTFKHFDRVRVASSMGHEQIRYKVKIPIIIRSRKIMATFTLADRSTQVYPVLIGRNTLQGKFIVDVSKGSPLKEKERERSMVLQQGVKEEHV